MQEIYPRQWSCCQHSSEAWEINKLEAVSWDVHNTLIDDSNGTQTKYGRIDCEADVSKESLVFLLRPTMFVSYMLCKTGQEEAAPDLFQPTFLRQIFGIAALQNKQ